MTIEQVFWEPSGHDGRDFKAEPKIGDCSYADLEAGGHPTATEEEMRDLSLYGWSASVPIRAHVAMCASGNAQSMDEAKRHAEEWFRAIVETHGVK